MPYNILISTKISIAVSLPINGIQAPAANKGIRLTRMPHKTSALMAENYLMQAARGGRRDKFLAGLDTVPEAGPIGENTLT